MSDDEEDSMELDRVVVDKCFRCGVDGASMKLLVCSVIGCPIAVHEECMPSEPEIDEKGRFYCPHCAHKRALLRMEKLRRKALRAKEVLSMFIMSREVSVPVIDGGAVRNVGEVEGIGMGRDERGESENQAMEVEENEDKEMDEDVRKENPEQQCVLERHGCDKRSANNAVVGIDQHDRGSPGVRGNEGKSPRDEQMRPAVVDAVVPESGDFQGGSPLLQKKRYKKKAQKVQVQRVIPKRIVSSPSKKASYCRTDAVEEDSEKRIEKDSSSSVPESRKVSELDRNEKGNGSAKSSDISELNQHEKAATSSESRKVTELDHNQKGAASSQSSDIPELNQYEKAATSSESRKVTELDHNQKGAASSKLSEIPELNQNEKAASASEVRQSQEFNQNEKVTTSCFGLNKVPESDHNEKATYNFSSESREIPERSQNEKATEVLSKSRSSRKVPDLNQNEKTTSSTEPIKVPESGSEEFSLHFGKRRRVNWTDDELKMLKEGVQLFSARVNKNIPWRKILDHGNHVFHKTRTPDNLKDKWKVLCREGSNKK